MCMLDCRINCPLLSFLAFVKVVDIRTSLKDSPHKSLTFTVLERELGHHIRCSSNESSPFKANDNKVLMKTQTMCNYGVRSSPTMCFLSGVEFGAQ